MRLPPVSDHMISKLVSVFILLTLCIGLSGYVYYRSQKQHLKKNIQNELSAVANLKATQLTKWHQERLGDATVIEKNSFIVAAAAQILSQTGATEQKNLFLAWMRSIQESYDYRSVLLIDPSGSVRLSTSETENRTGPHARDLIMQALRNRRSLLSDFHSVEAVQYPHLDLAVPLLLHTGDRSIPVGALLLRIDPELFLYPLIKTWPSQSRTAETLLIRRDKDELVILSELRHRKIIPGSFRIPLAKKPALAALLETAGQGIIELSDYREVPVLAYVQPVPNTPWLLISKVDQDEIYASIHEQARLISIVIGMLIASAGVSIVLWWRKEQAELSRKQADAESAQRVLSQRYDYLSKYANDIIMLIAADGRIVEANDSALDSYGYSRQELLGLSIAALRAPETVEDITRQMQQIREQNGMIFETVHKRKNGILFPVEISSRIVEVDGKSYFQGIIRDITERKQAEIALINEKNRSDAIIAALGDGISIQDRNYMVLYQNQVHKDMIGDHLGAFCYEAYEKRSSTCEGCPVAESFRDGKVHMTERIVPFEDGVRYFEITSSPLRDETGAIIAGIEAAREVTWRKKTELAVIESEKRYRTLFDHSLNAFALHEIITNPDGTPVDYIFLEVNRAFEEQTGLKAADIIGKRVTEVIPVIVQTPFIAIYGTVALTGEPKHFEQHAPPPLNKYFEIAAFSPAPRRFATIFFDITARKLAEQAQHESEKRYKRLIESVTDYIYTVMVENGQVAGTIHGPGCVTVTGYTTEEYSRDPDLWYRMIFEEDRDTVIVQANSILGGAPANPFEHRIIHKDGSIRWVRNTTVPRFDNEGRLIAYDGLISDITPLKQLENQLRQAQKMEAIGQLAGGVAHDFNNILTAIIGYANLLLMKLPTDDHRRVYTDQIISSSERAAHLTNSLLAFSRKQIIDLKPVSLHDVIKRVGKLLARIIGEDIEFKTRLSPQDLTILADSVQIEQVMMNLATNARDAMPDGGTLLIETEPVELGEEYVRVHAYGKPGRYANIMVTDTGTGMDEATRNKIFEPFFTTKEVGKGTGLGLSMVYGIIKQHNGFINVYSEPGTGTTFKIYLPLIQSDAAVSEPHIPAMLEHGSETVLLAEDDDAVRKLTKNVLEDFGYEVLEAFDGEDAVRQFTEHKDRIDLLLIDVIMPRKNGKEAYLVIKNIRPDIKALFMSGYTADIIHRKGILDTGFDFILKPIAPSNLLKKVREVLDKK